MNDFYGGQQIMCTCDKFKHVSIDQFIRKRRIYTIRWVGMYKHLSIADSLGSRLRWIHRGDDDCPEGYGAADMSYRASRFRILVRDRIGSLRMLLPPGPDVPR